MPNNKLRGKGKFIYIDDNTIKNHLCQTISNYEQTGLDKKIEGYERTRNLCKDGKITWENLLYIKDRLDTIKNGIGTKLSNEQNDNLETMYKVSGGELFHNWLNNKINHFRAVTKNQRNLEKSVKNTKPQMEHILISKEQLQQLNEKLKND